MELPSKWTALLVAVQAAVWLGFVGTSLGVTLVLRAKGYPALARRSAVGGVGVLGWLVLLGLLQGTTLRGGAEMAALFGLFLCSQGANVVFLDTARRPALGPLRVPVGRAFLGVLLGLALGVFATAVVDLPAPMLGPAPVSLWTVVGFSALVLWLLGGGLAVLGVRTFRAVRREGPGR